MSPRLAWSFLRRDFKIAVSYRASLAMQVFGILISVPVYYFMGGLVDSSNPEALKPYGGSYFGFLLIGVALLDYLTVSLRSFGQSLRESQLTGTLEIVLLSPTTLIEVLLYSSLWFFLFTSLRFLLYLVVGTFFQLDLHQMNVFGAVLVLFMGVLSFIPFGILTASLIMLIKRGESLSTLVAGASLFFGGVLFPVASMPEWLQVISKLLPFTYALEGMRQTIQNGLPTSDLLPTLLALGAFTVVLWPLSFATFIAAVRRTRVTGTLAHY